MMKILFGLVVAAMLGGCVALPYYDAYPQQYQYQAPPVQYAPQVQYVPPPVVYYRPMYTGGYYGAPMYYGDPLFRFNFNFGGGKKHHGGGRHHRR